MHIRTFFAAAVVIAGTLVLAAPQASAGSDSRTRLGTPSGAKISYQKRLRHHRRVEPVRVDAPFTRVETRRHRSVSVDAPFTSVRVRTAGVWVRAPFVDLYVPR